MAHKQILNDTNKQNEDLNKKYILPCLFSSKDLLKDEVFLNNSAEIDNSDET